MVGQKQIIVEFKDKMIEIAEATYGVDIKKKVGSQALVWYYFNREEHRKKMNGSL